MSEVEQPAYRVVMAEGATEIRDYGPTIVSETEARGARAAAIGQGFRLIAGYAFGADAPKAKIVLARSTQSEPELQILIRQLKLAMSSQPPPKITGAAITQASPVS